MIKTSSTHPIEVAFVGSELVRGPGAIGFTIAPGKRAAAADGHTWERDLDADLARIRQSYATDVVVSLLEPDEQHRLGIRNYRRSAKRHGLELIKCPIPDAGVPAPDALLGLANDLAVRIDAGKRVVVHCRGGLGRSGLVTAAVLIVRGLKAARAIESVRACRPGAIETQAQERMLYHLTDPSAEQAVVLAQAREWIGRLRLAPAARVGSLDVFPVLGARDGLKVPYLLGPEAIEQGQLRIAEMPGGGAVQRLQATSLGQPVLVLEGETLVGCKQNRVVTRTVLVPANSTVYLEVGCMEQGRWNAESRHFTFGGGRMEGGIRRQTQIERSRSEFDQQRLWSQVSQRLQTSGVASQTSDYHSFVTSRASAPGTRLGDVATHPDQVGVLVVHGESLIALELLPTAALWKQVAERTLQGLVLHDDAVPADRPSVSPARVLADVAERSVSLSRGSGLGWDVSIAGKGFAGSGLWVTDSMAHLAVFGVN